MGILQISQAVETDGWILQIGQAVETDGWEISQAISGVGEIDRSGGW